MVIVIAVVEAQLPPQVAGRERVLVSRQDAADADHVRALADVMTDPRDIRVRDAAGAVVLDRQDGVGHEESADPALPDHPRKLGDTNSDRLLRLGDVRFLLREPVRGVE